MTDYLSFEKEDWPKIKTEIWQVRSKAGYILGSIKWFSRWRQYAFFPCPETVWNPDCLKQVNTKIRELMAERALARQTLHMGLLG